MNIHRSLQLFEMYKSIDFPFHFESFCTFLTMIDTPRILIWCWKENIIRFLGQNEMIANMPRDNMEFNVMQWKFPIVMEVNKKKVFSDKS